MGTLALYYGDRVVFGALKCGSWACPHCRKRLSASLLDRMRRGMESRSTWGRWLVTLTLDPFGFGAVRIGTKVWDDGRKTALVSPPSPDEFAVAIAAMSKEWNRLTARMSKRSRSCEEAKAEFLRVVELHRSAWPHYHVVVEHPTWTTADVEQFVNGWQLGSQVEVSEISIDDAVGEIAPYLVSAENKSKGTKAWQFAGYALPAGFRLVQPSRGYLAEASTRDEPKPTHSVTLRGHFAGFHQAVKEMGADARLILYPPSEGEYTPPARTVAYGDAAIAYYAGLVEAKALHLSGGFRSG